MLRKFFIWLVRSLLILLLVTLIFSAVTFDFPKLMKGIFGDIFAYASPEMQKNIISKLAETCSALEQGQTLVGINQVCTNASLLDSMQENCRSYKELKRKGMGVENEEQIRKTCEQLDSGEIERACSEFKGKNTLLPDFSNIGALCKDYKNSKINDREFFFGVISSPLANMPMQMPQINIFDKYNKTLTYLNNNRILYFVILAILLGILYLLLRDVKLFLITLSSMSFSIGIIILLPYFAILAYEWFVGIDTTSILGMVLGAGTGFNLKAVISVALLLILRTYNSFIINLGIIFILIGIIGRIYSFVLKRRKKTTDVEKKEKVKELLDELEESAKKKRKEN